VRRADRVTALLLLALSVAFVVVGRRYPYWGENGPGSGFFPFWLGLAMGVLAVLLFVGAARPGRPDAGWLPAGRGRRRLVAVIGLTVAFVALLDRVGMILGTALFLLVVLRFVEGYSWHRSAGVALGAAAACYLVFVQWLRVPLPAGALGF
jgi:putative tricarboxylic transport membrane protein